MISMVLLNTSWMERMNIQTGSISQRGKPAHPEWVNLRHSGSHLRHLLSVSLLDQELAGRLSVNQPLGNPQHSDSRRAPDRHLRLGSQVLLDRHQDSDSRPLSVSQPLGNLASANQLSVSLLSASPLHPGHLLLDSLALRHHLARYRDKINLPVLVTHPGRKLHPLLPK